GFMVKHLAQDEKIVSVTGTVVIHLLLLLIFLLIHVDFRPMIEEFAELSFAGAWQAPAREARPDRQQPQEQAQTVPEEVRQKLPEKIDLPERRQLDLDDQEIIEKVKPEPEKLASPGNVVKKTPTATPDLPQSQAEGPVFARREKQTEKGLFSKQMDDKLLQGTQDVPMNTERPFEIDWQGEIEREIYQQRLPEFPPEVQREATIKIEFTVLPSGLVGSAILLQKGESKLENLTLESFKTWRFSPLPDYVEQTPQSGVITFHFKLR
ncbi:MAG: TonB family protein, partial [Calditrichia bacterium]